MKNRNKEIYQTIPEGCNRESQPYKKEAGTPDKDTRRWVVVEPPESCRWQFLGWTFFYNGKKAFTLIELLVVVLIIGTLAAIVVPQYQKAVEKARMAEAIIMVKKIAEAQQRFYMANGRYATFNEIDALDISIPHTGTVSIEGQNRLLTKNFYYTNQGSASGEIAVATRYPREYYLNVFSSNPTKIICNTFSFTPKMQKELCKQLNATGSL